jgi:hypothetical protein
LDRRGSEFGGDAFHLLVQVQCRNIREKILSDKKGWSQAWPKDALGL